MMLKIYSLLLAILFLQACTTITAESYRDVLPTMVPQEFFVGQLTAHGVVKNRSGLVIRTFNANIEASWKAEVGTLVEDFIFDDGEKQQRVWTLTPDGNGSYVGTANDVIGYSYLRSAGNSLFLNYVLRIPYGDSTLDIHVDDRMYLVAPNILINESSMSKLGLQVGSITLVIIRHSELGSH
ncbi:MAG: hypothetical protein ACI9JM_002352 [Halioglobus sp.]|jgi:hypothetical protein